MIGIKRLVLIVLVALFCLPAHAATTAESVYTVLSVSNVYSSGNGTVQFKVFWNTSNTQYQAVVWSQNSYGGVGCAYRQWYVAPASGPFQAWTRTGGSLCVEWPPTISGMNNSLQLVDVDQDGDLDAFQLVETSTNNWSLYLYKNNN